MVLQHMQVTRKIFCSAVVLFFIACGRSQEEAATTAAPAAETGREVVVPAQAQTQVYACSNNMRFTLRVLPDTVWVELPGRTVRLPRDNAARGTRYSNGDIDFSVEGADARLETEETTYTGCRT